MSLEAASAEIIEQGGKLIGPFRAPVNLAASAKGSIHDDETAQKLGFRGGTVAGSIHMEQFPPILMRAFGNEWWETGSLSCYFRNATLHGERVRPIVEVPGRRTNVQVPVWMERDDGMLVLEGTASVGEPGEPTALRQRLANVAPRGETRILAHLEPGLKTGRYPARYSLDANKARLEATTEPLEWYTGDSPWGGPIVNPGMAVTILRSAERGIPMREHKAVGLFGAIEVRYLAGPIFAERDYECSAELLAVGESPRSEYLWYESTLYEGERAIAAMIMMLRFMKGSSELWA